MHQVAILALPGVVPFDLSVPIEVFGGEEVTGLYDLVICTTIPGLVRTSAGLSLHIEHGLERLTEADTIIVPGALPLAEPSVETVEAIRAAYARGARVVSLCTGAFTLAAAGLLTSKHAATHWSHADDLRLRLPQATVHSDALYVEDAGVWSSAGGAAGIDLCIQLVRLDYGAVAASSVARYLVVAPHREGNHTQVVDQPVPETFVSLSKTREWARTRLHEPLTVKLLAAHSGWAPSTFSRRFLAETGRTPLRWLNEQRLLLARRLLEETDLTVQEVALHSGLGRADNLRLHFARDLATTPTAYRRAAAQQSTVGRPAPIARIA